MFKRKIRQNLSYFTNSTLARTICIIHLQVHSQKYTFVLRILIYRQTDRRQVSVSLCFSIGVTLVCLSACLIVKIGIPQTQQVFCKTVFQTESNMMLS